MDRDITVFGTCRLANVSRNNKLHEDTTYTHCTKEIIQLYKFLNEELTFEEPYDKYCFRKSIFNNSPTKFKPEYKQKLHESRAFLVEICSRKKYIHNNYYLFHNAVDTRFKYHRPTVDYIKNEYVKQIQSDQEIEHDIIYIKNMIYPKPLIIVSHYNSILHGKLIESRDHLIKLLEHICIKNNIKFINPTSILKPYPQHMVITEDLGHYTSFGEKQVAEYIDNYLSSKIFPVDFL